MKQEKFRDYALMFVLLFFSGNPVADFFFGKFTYLIALILTVILLGNHISGRQEFYIKYFKIALFLFIIFALQWAMLGFQSWLGAFNFLTRILVGGLIINYFKDHFREIFFKLLYTISFISLFLFLVINIAGIAVPRLELNEYVNSYLIYTDHIDLHRNSGMFWEPGAFSGILTLCIAVNFNNLQTLWKNQRFKLLVIFISLLSTLSTAGYIIAFVILIFYLISTRNVVYLMLFVPLLIIVGLVLYSQLDFISGKIEDELGNASEQRVGEYSNDRLGSIIFDWHYIKKHPLIGNGINQKTRYADDPDFATAQQDLVGSGNTFSGFWASMGIFFILGYFVLLYRSFSKSSQLYAILILVVVFLNFQDEQWLFFPLYLGLPFIVLKSERFMALKPASANKLKTAS